jgi:threonine-phosphate decarboxylase
MDEPTKRLYEPDLESVTLKTSEGLVATLKSASAQARKEMKGLKRCVHGGEVWDVANKNGISINDLTDFSSSINPLGPSPIALEAIKNCFGQLPLYPDSNSNALREAIAKHFGGIGSDNVVVGNGSTELIYLFADVFLKKGDSALIAAPSFGEYASAVIRSRGKPKLIKLRKDFQIEPSDFNKAMAVAKAAFLCNPNNPTSMLIPPDSLIQIVEKALDENVILFLDEDFIEFVENEKANSLVGAIDKYPNLFVLRTFTKFYGLTGLRVGYGIAEKETIDLISRAKMPWNVNSLAQAAAVAALTDKDHSKKTFELVKQEKQFLSSELAEISGFKVFPADTNFYLIDVRATGLKASEFKEKMIKYGILIRDCSSFTGLDEFYVRVAVRSRKENEKMLDAFRRVLKPD